MWSAWQDFLEGLFNSVFCVNETIIVYNSHSTTAIWSKLGVNFAEGGKPECPDKNVGVRLRATETRPIYAFGM